MRQSVSSCSTVMSVALAMGTPLEAIEFSSSRSSSSDDEEDRRQRTTKCAALVVASASKASDALFAPMCAAVLFQVRHETATKVFCKVQSR
jgi:hypothetical protein